MRSASLLRHVRRPVTSLVMVSIFGMACTEGARMPPAEIVGIVMPDETPWIPVGYLVVYTRARPFREGDTAYYPHLPYRIFDEAGGFLRTVRNHRSNYDERPTRVELPVGRYVVVPDQNGRGRSGIAVVIKASRTTKVEVEAMLKRTRTH